MQHSMVKSNQFVSFVDFDMSDINEQHQVLLETIGKNPTETKKLSKTLLELMVL